MARIARRHRRAGTDDPQLFSDDPRDVLTYLRKLPFRRFLSDPSGDDVLDGLKIRLWLWWEGEAHELRLLDAAEALGVSRRAVGAELGITTSQGVVDRRDRKRMMLGPHGRPDEKAARAQRRAAGQAPAAPPPGLLWDFVVFLHGRRDLLPEDIAEDVDYLFTEIGADSANLRANVELLIADMREHDDLAPDFRDAITFTQRVLDAI